MKKVLYINNDQVRILQAEIKNGEVKVAKSLNFTLEEGSVINGVLIKSKEILNIIKGNRKLLKGATIVLNSSNIQIKKLDHPELKGNKLNNYIRNEFSIPDDGSLIYGSTSRKIGNQIRTLFMSVPQELLTSYFKLFKEAGIKPGRIEILQNGMAKFVKNRKNLANQTFVLNLIEGSNLISVLIEAGEYVLTDRNRLMAEPGTDEFLDELITKLSSMIQFNISQKSPYEITKSYYVGLPAEKLNILKEKSESKKLGLDIVGFIDDYFTDKVALTNFCCYMGLMENVSDLNLKKYYKKQLRKKKKRKWGIFIVSLALLISLGCYGFLKVSNLNKEAENTFIADRISNSLNKADLAELIIKQRRINEIPIIVNELSQIEDSSPEKQGIDSNILSRILIEAGKNVELTNITGDVKTRSITISGTGTNEFSGSKFIGDLKNTGLFSKVEYSGYTSNGVNEYSFNAICIIK